MLQKTNKIVLCAAVTTGLLAPMTAAFAQPAHADAGSYSTNWYGGTAEADQDVKLASYTIEHTYRGAKVTGKLEGNDGREQVTLRLANGKALTGQTANFEWEYTDSEGNFEINISDFRDYKDRNYQIELGGGYSAWYSYGDIIGEGTIKRGDVLKVDNTKVETPEAPAGEARVVDYTATHTATGMVLKGKVADVDGNVTLRASANELTGQTGWYNVATPDADGNFEVSLTKFTNSDPRFWQLETGDGASYGDVLSSGKVSAGATSTPEPAPTTPTQPAPTTPAPAPTTPAEAFKVTFTDKGSIYEGKVDGAKSGDTITFRNSASALTGQTGFYEQGTADANGNVKIEIADFTHTKDRYWQVEIGGGYSTYGKVVQSGKVSSSGSVTTPAPAPTTPTTPKPTEPAPAPAPTTGTNPSNGKGGAYTDRTFINYTAAGKSGQYHVYASGIDTSKPVGVVFQFHGDGGYEFKNPSYKLPGLNKAAKEQNMIFVSMKSPNSNNVWWDGMEANGDYARSLMQNEILGKYNIDKNKVWLVGYSGGAQFISQEVLEEHSDLFTGGGAVMFGGGAAPYSFDKAPTADFKKNFNLVWHTGLDDGMGNSDPGWSALASAQKGSAFYKNAGFSKVTLETPAGIDHFEYDEPGVFKRILNGIY